MIAFDFSSSRVRPQCRLADLSHPENPRTHPRSACLDCASRAIVFRIFALKIRQDTLGAITGPDRQGLMVGLTDQLGNPLIQIRPYEF